MEPTRFPLAEEIPVQQLRIERLARDLVPSAHDAEDLTQEAWLAALRRRGAGVEHFGGWLRTVTVRLAGKRAMRGRNRRVRESRAARSEAEPSFVETLERRSLREYLERQVAALEVPYREVVRLRYLEELTPETIAVRLGRSPGTVRSQISRGLALLRVRIDGHLDADRGLRGTALLAWLARRPAQALCVGAAAVVVGVFVLGSPRIMGTRPRDARSAGFERATPADRAITAAPTPVARADSDTRTALRTADPTRVAGAGGAALSAPRVAVGGRVVDHRGAPVPEAEIWVSPPGVDESVLAAYADVSGAYRLDSVAPDAWVGARLAGLFPSPRLQASFFVRAGVAEIDLVIPRKVPGRLVVKVRTADGTPVANAAVCVVPGFSAEPFLGPDLERRRLPEGYAGPTDVQGTFTAWKLGGRVSYVRVEAPGHPPLLRKTRRSFLLPERLVITLPRPAALAGGLRLPDGTPARGALVVLERDEGLPPRESLAGPDGAFAFDNLAPGFFRLRVSGVGLASLIHEGELEEGAQLLDLELSLSRDWSVAGVAVDGGGAPLAGARVTLAGRSTLTEQDGSFVFGAVGPRAEPLRVYGQEHAVPVAWVDACRAGDTALRLVAVEPAARVVGRLTQDTRLSLRAPYLEHELTLVDGAGALRSEPLQPGPYDLVARGRELPACVLRRFVLSAGEVLDLGELAPPRPGSLRFSFDGAGLDGTGAERAGLPKLMLKSDLLTLRWSASFAPAPDATAHGGVLRLERIPPGTYDLFLTMPRYADILETIEIEDGRELVRELTLVRGVRRDFTFEIPGGLSSPRRLPALRLHGPAGIQRLFSIAPPRPDDREGPFLSLNLAPGTYTLEAQEGELRGQVTFTVEGLRSRPAAEPIVIELEAPELVGVPGSRPGH